MDVLGGCIHAEAPALIRLGAINDVSRVYIVPASDTHCERAFRSEWDVKALSGVHCKEARCFPGFSPPERLPHET